MRGNIRSQRGKIHSANEAYFDLSSPTIILFSFTINPNDKAVRKVSASVEFDARPSREVAHASAS